MILLATFLGAIYAVNSAPIDSRDCFDQTKMYCMENFVDAVFYSNTSVDECSELGNFVDCSSDAVDECFGDERDHRVDKGLEKFENFYKEVCSGVSSGDNSDFDEETYHIQLTATMKRKRKRVHPPKTHQETSESSDTEKCFKERKNSCWNTFEYDVVRSIFYSNNKPDECDALQSFVLCARTAADDCFKDGYNQDAEEVFELWENKYKEFCGAVSSTHLPPDQEVNLVNLVKDPRYTLSESIKDLLDLAEDVVFPAGSDCNSLKPFASPDYNGHCLHSFLSFLYNDPKQKNCRREVKTLQDCLTEYIDDCFREKPNEIIEAKVIEIKKYLTGFCDAISNDEESTTETGKATRDINIAELFKLRPIYMRPRLYNLTNDQTSYVFIRKL